MYFDQVVGVIPNFECVLKLKEMQSPYTWSPDPFFETFHESSLIWDQPNQLVDQGVVEKIDHSAWCRSLVVLKPDKSVKICADYKITLNSQLQETILSTIPKIEDSS